MKKIDVAVAENALLVVVVVVVVVVRLVVK